MRSRCVEELSRVHNQPVRVAVRPLGQRDLHLELGCTGIDFGSTDGQAGDVDVRNGEVLQRQRNLRHPATEHRAQSFHGHIAVLEGRKISVTNLFHELHHRRDAVNLCPQRDSIDKHSDQAVQGR